ncbi:hypothetical protein MMC29_006135 [Sticta canariensis]|nr:hypothetical protein [Sticta canariensis]
MSSADVSLAAVTNRPAEPAYWIENLKILWDAAGQFQHDNSTLCDQLLSKIPTRSSRLPNIKELTGKLRLAEPSGTRSTKSATRPDPDEFNGDKDKLDLFVTRFRPITDTLRNIDSVGTAEHELFCLYQTNKDPETFLNNFLLLVKKSKTGDRRQAETLSMLYENLSDELKDRLASHARQNTLGGLIKQLREIDSRLKVISKQHLVRTGRVNNTNSTTPTPRSALRLAVPAAIPVPVASNTHAPAPSSGSGTHAGPMDHLPWSDAD